MEYPEIDFVLGALAHYNIPVLWHEDPVIYLKIGAQIEIESRDLYKLIDNGIVIAPFDEVNELCRFILKM